MDFTENQIHRYARHILLKEVGGVGQEKLLKSKVLVLGAGGLGSPVILYLAAAGVGTIGVIDNDRVDLSNLQRQIAHTTARIGMSKVSSAAKKCDWILANDVSLGTATFGGDRNTIHLVTAEGVEEWPTLTKRAVAERLASRIAEHLRRRK